MRKAETCSPPPRSSASAEIDGSWPNCRPEWVTAPKTGESSTEGVRLASKTVAAQAEANIAGVSVAIVDEANHMRRDARSLRRVFACTELAGLGHRFCRDIAHGDVAAFGNELAHEDIRRAFVSRDFERAIRPLIGMEAFNVPKQDLPQLGGRR